MEKNAEFVVCLITERNETRRGHAFVDLLFQANNNIYYAGILIFINSKRLNFKI